MRQLMCTAQGDQDVGALKILQSQAQGFAGVDLQGCRQRRRLPVKDQLCAIRQEPNRALAATVQLIALNRQQGLCAAPRPVTDCP